MSYITICYTENTILYVSCVMCNAPLYYTVVLVVVVTLTSVHSHNEHKGFLGCTD